MKRNQFSSARHLCLALTLLLLATLNTAAQQSQLGELAPDFRLKVLDPMGKSMGYQTRSDFSGKWLILDFWTRSCMACITAMPKLSAMQQRFEDKAVMLLVGKNDKKYNSGIQKFYARLAKNENLRLYNTFDTTIFSSYAVAATPHVAIIDSTGLLYTVTSSSELSAEKIAELIAGKRPVFAPLLSYGSVKKQQKQMDSSSVVSENITSTLRVDSLQISGKFLPYRSELSTWNSAEPPSLHLDLNEFSNRQKFKTNATSLERLYLLAYFGKASWRIGDSLYAKVLKEVRLEILDSSRFVFSRFKSNALYTYSMEMLDAKPSVGHFQKTIQADLGKRFGFSVGILDTNVSVYRLSAKKQELRSSLNESQVTNSMEGNVNGYLFKASPISAILERIAYFHPKQIFEDFNESSFLIDLKLEANMLSLESIASALERSGLSLEKMEKKVKVLVIRPPRR